VSFFESLKRIFGGSDSSDTSARADSSGSSDAAGETAVAMIPCEEATARLFEYLDGELEGVSEEEVRQHLEICKACYPRAQFERHFLDALHRSQNGGRVSSGGLRERVLQALAEDKETD
jgi:anti-sigma factor (TIGR02949 family)